MPRNRKLVKPLLIFVVAMVAREYARYTYITAELAGTIVYSQQDRPFVYRVLVPWLSWSLTRLGISPEISLTIFVVASAIGFLYALNFLFQSFRRS